MKRPKTRWARVTLVAWIFAGAYLFAIIVTQPHWVSNWGWDWPPWVRDVTGAGLAVALMIISIWYGGNLTNFYDLLTGFGISGVRVDRHCADSPRVEDCVTRACRYLL
jgi:hypothetical protein